MPVSDSFKQFLSNIKIENDEQISYRYGQLTTSLNKKFRDTESITANSLQVGSYGRYTGIKGISDLDILYIMPSSEWDSYNKDGGQAKLLSDTRDAIFGRYPKSKVRVDRLVVTVTYKNFHVEVQPVFEKADDDGNSYFSYPDTYSGGSWKRTKPRQEMQAVKDLNAEKNKNLRLLCKMARAWRNKNGVAMGGLLIDTLAYNFMKSTDEYDTKSYMYFDSLSRDFFGYLSNEPNHDHYKAPGSGQNVKVKKHFQAKAMSAYELCLEAIKSDNENTASKKWKKVFGINFPAPTTTEEVAKSLVSFENSEEFIEDYYPIDVRNFLRINCDVHQGEGPRKNLLEMLARKFSISSNKKLVFKIIEHDILGDFEIKWKVLNKGSEARKRDCIRGRIEEPNIINNGRKETANFAGNHIVECFALQDGVVVARDSIEVPILGN